MIHWYLFDVCFAPVREPSLCTFIGFSLFVFLSRSFLRLSFSPAISTSYCRCYSYYVLLLRVMKFLLVLYNIAIYFTDCFASVFTALWVCKCVPNLLISVFVFVFSVFVLHLFLYSIKHDYPHCSFCLYWFAFAFLQYQQHMVYFTPLFINTFLFSISHSPLAVSNLMRFSLVLWFFLTL